MTRSFFAVLALFLALAGCGSRDGLTVFAAASLTDALTEAAALFTEREGFDLRLNFASSGTLARQLEAGADADVFLSANLRWMAYLEGKGLVDGRDRASYFGNRLALVVPKGSGHRMVPAAGAPVPPFLLEGTVAVGETGSVPAGIYARQTLLSLGWMKGVEQNLVACDNVRSALMLVARGEVKSGIVYLSDAEAEPGVEIAGIFPDESHDPIIYPAAVVAAGRHDAGRDFLDFLGGPEAAAVLTDHGFLVPAPGEPL